MTSWAVVSNEQPELAADVARAFGMGKHATMATVRADGAPRISGTEVDFVDGEFYLAMMPGTRRAADLRRDPRVAVHSPTIDPPADDPSRWAGEAKIGAIAVEVDRDRFRLDITQLAFTRILDGKLQVIAWTPGGGLTVAFRD